MVEAFRCWQRQWRVDELVQAITEHGTVARVERNAYVLGIALMRSTRLRFLGSMVWVADSMAYVERRETAVHERWVLAPQE